MSKLTRTLTKSIWNGNVSNASNLGYFLSGAVQYRNGNIVRPTLCDWPLLSKYDFEVWEIIDGYCNRDDDDWDNYTDPVFQQSVWGRLAAEMLYTVRYGVPRHVGVDTIRDCPGSARQDYILRWDPPSDYAIGFQSGPDMPRKPGTRLQSYNIYRKAPNDPVWPQLPIHQIFPRAIAAVSGLPWQETYPYPWWRDNTATPGETYQYMIRTQDWSVGIINESNNSDIITITYPYDRLEMQLFPSAVVPAGQTVTVAPGIYYVPFPIDVAHGGSLILSPGTVLNFADSMWLSNHGTMTGLGGQGCENLIVFQGTHELPGSWWGVYHYADAAHTMRHCVVRYGIENIVLWDPVGEISNTEVHGASRVGIIVRNAQETNDIQKIDDCFIHDNDWRNVLIWPEEPETIYPFFRRDKIEASKYGDGITAEAGSNPLIQNCEIRYNAQHGIAFDLCPAESPVHECVIEDHQFGHGISLFQSTAVTKENAIARNLFGIDVSSASLLLGGQSYGDNGYNSLVENNSNLSIAASSVVFGLWATPSNIQGGYNCFSDPVQYHVIADAASSGTVDVDGFSPDDPGLFSIAQNPTPVVGRSHDHLCTTLRSEGSSSKEMAYSTSTVQFGDIHGALRGGNYTLALALLRNAFLQPSARGRFMPLLSHHAALATGAPYRHFLDSLAGTWTGNQRASVHRARMPYLLAGRHWSEARDAISSMASSSVVPADAIARYALFVQASDSATRREFVANFFANGSLVCPDSSISKLVSAYWYASVRSDVPYVFPKTSTEIETSPVPSSILTVFPNPTLGRDAVVHVQFHGEPQGELIVATLLGIEEQRLVIQDPNNSGNATLTIGPLPVGVHLLQWRAGGTSVCTILHVLN